METEEYQKPTEENSQNKTFWQSFWELVRFALLALVIVVPIRVFIVEPFVVSGSSMVPTFKNGNYLIVDKVSYKLGDPQRDDVIVFRYPVDQTKFFIKRIIGLPNETVDIKDGIVTITNSSRKDGFELREPYTEKNTSSSNAHYELESDEYFVMGDNRNFSSDSRYWGAVKRKFLVGKAFLRLLPISDIGIFPGRYKQSE